MKNKKLVSLEIQISAPIRARLEKLREQMASDDLSIVFRQALAVYEALWSLTREKGGRVIVKMPGDNEEIEEEIEVVIFNEQRTIQN